MKKSLLRISAVSYINAKPFVYGIKKSGFLKNYSLSLDIPSRCAEKLISGKADIGLAPIAILPKLKEYYIFPDFCIGANGPVKSVMLYSEVPLKKIKTIYLDNQSRTSVMLGRILAKHFWKISPEWINAKKGYEEKIKGTSGGVIIGDRNFSLSRKHKFSSDLSEQWQLFTGLPFVFACWISNKKLTKKESSSFSKALKFGLKNKNEILKNLDKHYDKKTVKEYLNKSISYNFDKPKQNAMNLFLLLCKPIA